MPPEDLNFLKENNLWNTASIVLGGVAHLPIYGSYTTVPLAYTLAAKTNFTRSDAG